MIHSYSSPFSISHKAVQDLFNGEPVIIQEKIDGSQISFGVFDGELIIRSKNQIIDQNNLDGNMFARGVYAIQSRLHLLVPGWTYRGEYLQKPKHNALNYARIPTDHIIIYDIDKGEQDYMRPQEVTGHVIHDLGLESVPYLGFFTEKPTLERLDEIINQNSVLGNVQMEGIVLKNYSLFGVDKKVLMAKYVSQNFRETHSKEWKAQNLGQKDVLMKIVETLRTDARWNKAIQHLRESGILTDSPQDIPHLIKEVNADVLKEETDWIKEQLFKMYWKEISKGLTRGLPEWYKELLLTNYEE